MNATHAPIHDDSPTADIFAALADLATQQATGQGNARVRGILTDYLVGLLAARGVK